MPTRHEIAQSAAQKLAAADLAPIHALLGFDGFIDQIIEVVATRHDHERYDRLATIAQFGARISAAAGKSSNFELVVKQRKLGGNGPIMAHALASLGLAIDYIGTVGDPAAATFDPVFRDFSEHAVLHPLAPPAHANALEFLDGKVMLGDLGPLSQVTWQRLLDQVGLEKLRQLCDRAALIGMVNWTMLPHLTSIWQHFAEQILPALSQKPRRLFIDLADPEKRHPKDLRAALEILTQLQATGIAVTLGLNLSEAQQVAHALNITGIPQENALTQAIQIRTRLNLDTVVIHPRTGAAAATATRTAEFPGPFAQHPRISTGAGDHFNAGFATGQLLNCTLEESLALGTALSGYYVRHALSPTAPQLTTFLENLPAPESLN